jgi:hypothetical protein
LKQRRVVECLACLNAAERLGYNVNECSAQRWTCHMLLGDFAAAWRECDAIFERRAGGPLALWDRKPFMGQRVLIRCLHGYGDAIQNLRYARLIAGTAAEVIVETHPEMVSLVSLIDGINRVTTWTDGHGLHRDEWDLQIEVTELPWAFRSTLETLPSNVPYIRVPSADRERSRLNLQLSGKPRVGILWASSTWNPERSIRLAELAPILSDERFEFFAFQRDPERAQLKHLGSRYNLHDTALHSPAIADTAADLTNMDLLITVDTMAAHLAGALAVPVWVMLPFEADWRWMLDRGDSPWYPTMRLFRQSQPRDWSAVVNPIAREIGQFAAPVQPHTRSYQEAIPVD